MYKIIVEIPEGWGGYFNGQKWEIPGRKGGLREIPSVVGVWIFSETTQFKTKILVCKKICFGVFFLPATCLNVLTLRM